MLKDRYERCTTTVCERIYSSLAVVRDEASDGHRLHRMGEDADCSMFDSRRGAE